MRYLMPIAVIAVVAGLGQAAVYAEDAPLSSSWVPETKLLEQLSEEAVVGSFRLRPPQGYQFVQQAGPNGAQAFAWKGERRPDGTAPSLMVIVAPTPEGEAPPMDLEKLLAKFLAGIQRRRAQWAQATAERGRIGERTFMRAAWSGLEPALQVKMHGFSYVAIDGTTVIQISSQDVEPYHAQTLPLAEASALTFH